MTSSIPLRLSSKFEQAIIDSMLHQVAIIDQNGTVQATNQAWDRFCLENSGHPNRCGIGMNYLQISSDHTTVGIKDVLAGNAESYTEEYPCHSRDEERWFILNATPLLKNKESGEIEGAVIIFINITERKLMELEQEKELEFAKMLQQSVLLPPLKTVGVEISGLYLPSDQLSGDMYAWYRINEHQYGVILLDIMGHGVSSGLISMGIRSLLQGIITRAVQPLDVYHELNKHFKLLFRTNKTTKSLYCTAIYALIDTREMSIQYFNAGNPNGLLLGGENPQALSEKTIPIGLREDPQVNCGTVMYTKGQQLFLYTDGLADSLKMSLTHCETYLMAGGAKHLRDIKTEIKTEEIEFEQGDDISIVTVGLR